MTRLEELSEIPEAELIELAEEATIEIIDFFEANEAEIALGLDGFSNLARAFHWFMGRPCEVTEVH
mgnify:CR=1 FL=1|tara:strand:- start:6205 stop:6402 length:198 start_codon:yes stop_codon:yes gene_type:complete